MKDRATRMRIQYGAKDTIVQDESWRTEFATKTSTNMEPRAGSRLEFATNRSRLPESTSRARCGTLKIKERQEVPTPNFYAVASRGVVPHLTPDVLAKHTEIGGVYIALEDLVEVAAKKTPPVLKCPARGSPPSRLHTFTALPAAVPTILAPRRLPAVIAPLGNTESHISIYTSNGFIELSSQDYAMYATRLGADIVISMPDIPYGTIPGSKKKAKMGDRTLRWLNELRSSSNDADLAIFAPILPLSYLEQRRYLDDLKVNLSDLESGNRPIEGLAIYDTSTYADFQDVACWESLPRLSVDMPQGPHDVLAQIDIGIDIFTLPFIGQATDAGLALVFSFTRAAAGAGEVQSLAIDMFSKNGTTDASPLMQGCECYTCKEHHIAYITHLLSAKEMLGWVLLQIHNHYIMTAFFSQIRASIVDGTFKQKKEIFERAYETDLPAGTGIQPRARGYQYKSEGPGEKKKNKPAWGQLGDETDGPLKPDEDGQELEEKGFAEVAT